MRAVAIQCPQHSSGGKNVLRGIAKLGDEKLRWLLIHGARASLKVQPIQHTFEAKRPCKWPGWPAPL